MGREKARGTCTQWGGGRTGSQTDTKNHRAMFVEVKPWQTAWLLQGKELHCMEEKEDTDESEATQPSHSYIFQIVIERYEAPTPCANCWDNQESRGKVVPPLDVCGVEERQTSSK